MGYAKRRLQPANGNSHSSVLKPVTKEKSDIVLWVGVSLLLLVAGAAALCLFSRREIQMQRKVMEEDDTEVMHESGRFRVNGKGKDGEKPKVGKSSGNVRQFVADEKGSGAHKNVRVRQDEGSKPSGMALDLGDYSNFQDTRFCRRHGINAKNVSTKYDVYRQAYVHHGSSDAQRIEVPGVNCKMILQYVECLNEVVEISEICVMTAEGENGTVKFQRGTRIMATAVVDQLSELSALSSEGNPIVASSPNVKYRGYNKRLVEDSLVGAVSDVLKKHGGVVAIQWRTPKCFVSWHFLAMKGVYTVISSRSDQIIRTNVFGNE